MWHVGGEKEHIQGFGGKSEGRRPLGRPKCKWEVNIKMDLQDVGCGGMVWIKLDQDKYRWRALAYAVMNLQVPLIAGKFFTN
jgi:hypothetical protein